MTNFLIDQPVRASIQRLTASAANTMVLLVGQPRLLLFCRQSFSGDLVAEAGVSKEVELIDLPCLYHGS